MAWRWALVAGLAAALAGAVAGWLLTRQRLEDLLQEKEDSYYGLSVVEEE